MQFARKVQTLSGIEIEYRVGARSSARNVVDGCSAWPIQPMSVGKPNRSGTTKVMAQNGGRVQGRTGGSRAKGQGRPVCLHDQLDAAQPLTNLPRQEDGPIISDVPADGDPPETLPTTAPRRDERPARPDVRRKAVDCIWGPERLRRSLPRRCSRRWKDPSPQPSPRKRG
jgi:hypothetical protein